MILPVSISSAIQSIEWPLSSPSLPMYYEPLSSLRCLRQPNSIPQSLKPIMDRGAAETIEDLTMNPDDPYSKHYAMISLALIFLGNGLADEAHDLVTPLSWSEDTYFGGPTMCAQTDESIVAIASYVHSLLHRKEGFAQGEFGMIGYQNANYWASATRTRGEQCSKYGTGLPYKEVREAVINLSAEYGVDAERWCKQHIIDQGGVNNCEYWETRALHELCANVSTKDHMSDDLKKFAEKAAEIELRILLSCCLDRAGCTLDEHSNFGTHVGDSMGTPGPSSMEESLRPVQVDIDLAQSTCNKVSSAHIGGFQSSDSVTIRRVVQSTDASGTSTGEDNNLSKTLSLSAAAGIGCRLLGSPAVKLSTIADSDFDSDLNDKLCIMIPMSESESRMAFERLAKQSGSPFYGGGPLAPGDAFAFIHSKSTGIGKNIEQIELDWCFGFNPCDPSDDNAVFVDRFNGSRGESPTSVLQWSKGTIHRST